MKRVVCVILAVLCVFLLSSCASDGIPEDIEARISEHQKTSDTVDLSGEKDLIETNSVFAIPGWDLVRERTSHVVRGKVIGIGKSFTNKYNTIETEVFFKVEKYLYGDAVHEDIIRVLSPCGTVGNVVCTLEDGYYDMTVGDELLLFLAVTETENDPYVQGVIPYITLVYTPGSGNTWNCTFESPKWEYQVATINELLSFYKNADK
ncbi:MAG: hypothetical protein IKL89_01610 [Clostridia bacterium]|nr:hypothetical protein [Clostridia bacterium]